MGQRGVGRAEQGECGQGHTEGRGRPAELWPRKPRRPRPLLGIRNAQPRAWPQLARGIGGPSQVLEGQEHCWAQLLLGRPGGREAWRRLRSPPAWRVTLGLGLPHRGPLYDSGSPPLLSHP